MRKSVNKLILLLVFLSLSCSKESDNSVNPTGGEIFRSQIVTVDFGNTNLSAQEYQGTFNGLPITLSKSEDNKLLFLVPYTTPLGIRTLSIPEINNTTISYEVKNTELTATPETTLVPFFTNINTFTSQLDNSQEGIEAQSTINSFNSYYANTTAEEKLELAILYKANKTLFDNTFLNTTSGKALNGDAICFGAAVIGAGASVVLLISPTGLNQIAGLLLLGPSLYYATVCGKPLYKEYVLTEIIKLGTMLGINNRTVTNLTFEDNVNSTLPLSVGKRKLTTSDTTRTEETWVYFFKYFTILNEIIQKANVAIAYVNTLPFVNFSLISPIVLPSSSPTQDVQVTSIIFEKLQFSVNNPNLQLVSSSLQSDGQINLKVKIIGTPAAYPVSSSLNYTYSDDFCSFSGSIPISVQSVQPSIIGTWNLTNFSYTIPVGQYLDFYAPGCNNLVAYVYTITSEVLQIQETSYNYTENEKYIRYNFSVNIPACTIYNDLPDTEENYTNSASGTYTLNGSNYITTENGVTHTATFSFINANKIMIDDKVYTRQ